MSKLEAVSSTVTGNDEQVGFRALVMKQAIQYNLAGDANNDANDIVHFTLQGDRKGIDSALATIKVGPPRSSGIEITTVSTPVDPALSTFTIVGWTSSSRNITTPYNLVFTLRASDEPISKSDAKAVWHQILQQTLDPEDQTKLQPDD